MGMVLVKTAEPAAGDTPRPHLHGLYDKLQHPLPSHTVLIDEAGQASEIAALQPLGFGAERCEGPGRVHLVGWEWVGCLIHDQDFHALQCELKCRQQSPSVPGCSYSW